MAAPRARHGARPLVPPEDEDVARCLAFVNTLSGRTTATPAEKLVSFDALVAWSREQALLEPGAADRLAARAKRRHDEAERVASQARDLRELLHDTFTATSSGRAPSPATLDQLSVRLGTWYRHGRLVPGDTSLQWAYAGGDELDRIVWEVARAAARLLTSPRLTRVRACAADDCGWWFLDETKNASRRWCDMKICGNREKLRRFRASRR